MFKAYLLKIQILLSIQPVFAQNNLKDILKLYQYLTFMLK